MAPATVCFYASDWSCLGTKGDLYLAIETITGIPADFLLGITDLDQASVAQRMSWAAGRKTKRREDVAYCLLGIFGVTMPMICGEGSSAFRRSQEQIMKDIGDDSLLAWGLGLDGQTTGSGLSVAASGRILAADPSDFANCGHIASRGSVPDSFELRGGSLQLPVVLYAAPSGETFGLLNCGPEHDADMAVGIPLVGALEGQPDEYLRPARRKAIETLKPTSDAPTKCIRILLDRKGITPAVRSQSCWYHIRRSVDSLVVVGVEPVSRWHKARSLR